MRILLVEDEPRIRDNVCASLEAAGYRVEASADGEDAWFRGDTAEFDLIVLDLGLPGLDGLTILKRWRSAGNHTPVLVLTARGSWPERVEGIDAGADDYLAKPFQTEELLARVRALLRRSVGHGSPVIAAGPLSVDTRQMRVSLSGTPLSLSPLEYRLVSYLLHHQARVVSPGELMDHLYGDDDSRDPNALEALVKRLRRKIGADLIETRRGFGYVLVAPE